ncbi:MAG TPA: lipid A-modifier LpxR family protein, partial [Spongiibacteraceae bacterium]
MKKLSLRAAVVGAMLTNIFCMTAQAEDGKGALTVALENDLFGAGTDKHYTHGTEISYVSDTYQQDW